MKRFIMLIIILLALVPCSSLYACTGFCISKGDTVLFGNNEDHIDPDSKVFYVPAEKGKYGKVYFGFDNPEGGMNEKGLVFDLFATEPNKVKPFIRHCVIAYSGFGMAAGSFNISVLINECFKISRRNINGICSYFLLQFILLAHHLTL